MIANIQGGSHEGAIFEVSKDLVVFHFRHSFDVSLRCIR
jgi:hypothetical protein